MDKTEIRKRWKSGIIKLIALAADARPNFDANQIHAFRIGYKKFRSFVRLLKTAIKGRKKISIPTELRYWFQELGEIRNLQIQLQYIDESLADGEGPATEYRKQMADLLIRKISFLNAGMLNTPHILSKAKRLGEKLPSHITRKKGLKFIEDRKERMIDVFGKGRTDLALHEIRKMLKDIDNVNNLFSTGRKNRTAKNEIENLVDELGRYQDLRIKLGYLKPQYLKAVNEQEKTALLLLKSRLQTVKQGSRTEIIGKILKSSYLE